MHLPLRSMSLGLVVALCTGPALADGIDAGALVRYGLDEGVTFEDWVSTDPLATHMVKKIEAGRVSYVTITETATGTYSSDGLASRHVLYPGISESSSDHNSFSFSSWNDGRWTNIRAYSGNSYVSVSTHRTARGETRTSTCVSSASFWYC
ncbi:hypothetical protein DMC47_26815 [Nostoc sp. 3335mG]|nr:hypothetical protein DMC47_26815 [Nostoc sp. 3335mG]